MPIDRQGRYEQMKGTCPPSAEDAQRVCETLGVVPPSAARAVYSREELRAEWIAPPRGVLVVSVHKGRVRYKIHGCMSEITDVVADGKKTQPVALEGEDPRKLIDAVRAVGPATFPNIGYPRGLTQLIGMKS